MTRAGFLSQFLLILPLFALAGCAERDNPYDPANGYLARVPNDTVPTDTTPPEPRPSRTSRIVDPDSVCRTCDFYATLETALSEAQPGDTIWIQGNRTYQVQDLLNISKGGTLLRPFVIRSFGGEARFIPARAGVQNLLRIGQAHVHIRGVAIVGAEGDGVLVNNVSGPVLIDSSRIDSCGLSGFGAAVRAGPAGVKLSLHDVQLRHNATSPALQLSPGVELDTSGVVETPLP